MVARQLTAKSRDRSAADVTHARRAPHRMRLLLAVLLIGSMVACDVNRLLDAKDKDTSPVGAINSATGLPNAYAGAISQFQVGWAGSAVEAGRITPILIATTAGNAGPRPAVPGVCQSILSIYMMELSSFQRGRGETE